MLLGIAVVSIVILVSDREALFDAISRFDSRLLPLILVLTICNYVLRFMKWEYYLNKIGVRDLSTTTSALIFTSGFSMAMTPGKVGEFLKSVLIRTRTGTPMTRTLPVVFAERLTDGLSMVVLSTVGLLAFRVGWPLFLVMSAVLGGILLFIQNESLVESLLHRLRSTRPVRRSDRRTARAIPEHPNAAATHTVSGYDGAVEPIVVLRMSRPLSDPSRTGFRAFLAPRTCRDVRLCNIGLARRRVIAPRRTRRDRGIRGGAVACYD